LVNQGRYRFFKHCRWNKRGDVEEIVERTIGDTKVTTSTYHSCVGALQKTRYTPHLEFRREELILFIAEAMVGDPAKRFCCECIKTGFA
jgi:hypothetical protein